MFSYNLRKGRWRSKLHLSSGFKDSFNHIQAQNGCKGLIIHEQGKVVWLSGYIKSIMTFIISKSCIHLVFRDSCKNWYLMLVVLSQFKIHTSHRVTAIDYLRYLPVKKTNIFSHTPNFHVLSLLDTTYLFEMYDLASQVTQFMLSIQFKLISNKHH